MSGAEFILAINVFVAGLLAAAFMAISIYDAKRASARWFALCYLTGLLYIGTEFSIPWFENTRPIVTANFAAFLATLCIMNVGLARRYEVPPPWRTMLVFVVAATVAVYITQGLPRDSLLRMMMFQTPYAAVQAMGAAIVLRSRDKLSQFDYGLAGVLLASALQFFSKPYLALAVGSGSDPHQYLQSTYAMISQALGTVFALSIALMLLVILVRDILADATQKSETDALSGLLNRGGFQRQAAIALREAERQGLPVTLVISDLDHFKSINDTYGHLSGDRVIEAFARFIHESKVGHHIAGRIGGEEFAIILPGTHLAAARLFAEGARSAFSALPIEGLPSNQRFTASFGVAELVTGEFIDQLMRRADAALYEAKKDGRDCVRVASGSVVEMHAESNIVPFGGKS
ncbi:GGDEF domain-containing protein [Aminobacter aganoensis]|uniref:diguanylate cyclase n=1 Tax=Aminobacter aganoensis TaxID=83264 RepID=A0A7X0KM05_9HYPH|nr:MULTISPECIES: GGDEF domain-containing protein [Aminobacter]KQU73173.1 diguanylate cyclase [Aminobacter sp. DSM 101952]MBB6355635.1 diguanylate cyclase (GGDEF)-like protein [Aminobacter aganoensis]